jgi:hypothetical protein
MGLFMQQRTAKNLVKNGFFMQQNSSECDLSIITVIESIRRENK